MGGSSANYDVELLHHSDMHRDVLRAGMSSLPSQFVTLYVIYTYSSVHNKILIAMR